MPFGKQYGGGTGIEPEYQDVYSTWKDRPDKHNTGVLLKTIQPSIDKAISANVGNSNPLIKSKARRMSLQALRTYDPSRAKLSTHLMNQLQGLKRVQRQQTQILSIPERLSLDQGKLIELENELQDTLGRDPTMPELADRSGLSIKRINQIRGIRLPVAEGTFHALNVDEEGTPFDPGVSQPQSNAWLELVHSDMDPVNQKIMEWSLGLHGVKKLSNQQIASKLRLSPGAISQRKSSIQKIIDQQQELSPF